MLFLVIRGLLRLLISCYQTLFTPLNTVKPLGSVGYVNHESYELSQKQLVNLVRKRRKLGFDVPPVYPNGWFRILDSRLLKKAEVKQVRAFGQNLVAFRGQSGEVSVLDAYCPHMGANLAVGGRVVGNCIECPFHGWKFDGKGKCVDIPYAKRSPAYADTKYWHSREINGNIYIWYHCDKTDPEWQIPTLPEVYEYKYGGRIEHHINTHIQDIPENGYDEPHLNHLHLPSLLGGVDLATHFDSKFNYLGHNVMKTDYCDMLVAGEKHIATIHLSHHMHFFKFRDAFYIKFRVVQIGPGIVHLYASTPLGELVIVQSITAVEPMEQVLAHAVYAPWYVPMFLTKLVLQSLIVQVDRDLMVWNNRTIMGNPRLQKEEKVQKTFRRWFSQFYSENSERLGDRKEGLDW